MGDVMTLFGASDQQFTSVVTQMMGTARRFKAAIESSPIRVPIEPAGPVGATSRGFGLGLKVFGSGMRGGSEGPAMGSGLLNGLGAAGTMAAGFAGTAGAATMVAVGVNRVLSRVSAAGREQEKWTREVMNTSNAYVQLATASMKPMDVITRARADALAEAQRAENEIAEKTNVSLGDDKSDFDLGWSRAMTDLSVVLKGASRIPVVGRVLAGYEYGDGKWHSEKEADTARLGQAQMNRVAIFGNRAAEAAAQQAARDKFITEGRAMSAGAAALQREAEAKQKEIAAREKAKTLATEDLRVSTLQNDAIVKRLTGHEKEAQLLEAKAAYLQKHLELERESSLTTEQKSQAQTDAWRIYQLQNADIEKNAARGGRSVGADLSLVGGASAAMMKDSVSDDLLKEAREQKELLTKIAANTAGGRGVAVMG